MTQSSEKKPTVLSDILRVRFKKIIDAIAAYLNGLGLMPNTITLLGLAGNFAAAVLLALGHFLAGGLLVLFGGALDGLDGSMARLRKLPVEFGTFADSVTDRYAELALFGGLFYYYLRQDDWLTAVGVYLAARLRAAPRDAVHALFLALVGLFLATSWGWQEAPVQLLPDESRPVGHDTPLAYRLDAFQLHINNRGQLAGYRSEISWLEGQAQVGQGVVSIGQPARRTGVALHQAGFVPVIRLSAQDEAGQPLLLESSDVAAAGVEEMLVRFSLPEDQPLVFLPHLNRFLALSFEPLCSIDRPAVHVDLLDEAGTSRQRLGSLSSSGALPLGDGQLLAELSYAPILRLDNSNMEIGAGAAPLARMLRAGLDVSLGDDGFVRAFDPFVNMSTTLLLHSLLTPGQVSALDVLSLHTTRAGVMELLRVRHRERVPRRPRPLPPGCKHVAPRDSSQADTAPPTAPMSSSPGPWRWS